MACLLSLSFSRKLYHNILLPSLLLVEGPSPPAFCVARCIGFYSDPRGLGHSKSMVSNACFIGESQLGQKELSDLETHQNVELTLEQEGGHQQEVLVWGGISVEHCIDIELLVGQESNSGLASALRRCGKAKAVSEGRRVHIHISRHGYDRIRFLGNCLIQMYGNCGSMEDARAVFAKISSPNLYSWTILLTAYGQNGSLEEARKVFGRMTHRSVVSWNAMMAAFVQNGCGKDALDLFRNMQLEAIQPDYVSFVCALDACTSETSLAQAKQIHVATAESGYVHDVLVGTALVTMYGKCGCTYDARRVFSRMPHRDIVCWNAMIAAFAQNDQGKDALNLFSQMQLKGIKPDVVSFLCALDACASLSALDKGQAIHVVIVDTGDEQHIVVGSALVNMYGKCGSLDDAKNVFSRMSHRNALSWNAIIGVFAQNGHSKEALNLFHQMQMEAIKPDSTTFISVLNACSHTGLLDVGRHFFLFMGRDHGIRHTIDHYGCMIDLLGRAGHLNEAENLLKNIPFEKDAVLWRCLLGACKLHGDVDRGLCAANQCFALDPKNATPFVMLSNIYAIT